MIKFFNLNLKNIMYIGTIPKNVITIFTFFFAPDINNTLLQVLSRPWCVHCPQIYLYKHIKRRSFKKG